MDPLVSKVSCPVGLTLFSYLYKLIMRFLLVERELKVTATFEVPQQRCVRCYRCWFIS